MGLKTVFEPRAGAGRVTWGGAIYIAEEKKREQREDRCLWVVARVRLPPLLLNTKIDDLQQEEGNSLMQSVNDKAFITWPTPERQKIYINGL